MLRRHLRAVTIIAISAAGFAAATSKREVVKPFSVYHDGDDLIFTPEAAGTRKLASVGPWKLGERLGEDAGGGLQVGDQRFRHRSGREFAMLQKHFTPIPGLAVDQ